MILCLDLETTGLNEQTCGLVGIGACWLHGGEFQRLCRPFEGAIIEPQALQVNGVTPAELSDPKRLPEFVAAIELLGWVRGNLGLSDRVQIAAWNAHFDHRHLMAALTRAGVGHAARPFIHRLIDLHSLVAGEELRKRVANCNSSFQQLGGEIANADEGSRLLSLPPEPKPHTPLAGARQVRAMLRRYLGETEVLP